ncbi:transcriptional regulator [Capnocytophaga canimorsus]|uniref:LexA family transcriptional regulator n=1 Tax=Capnocytophaga canimorsus TaxID=28188 RepID=UPI001AC3C8E9|nr:S24 family peptidase [Capnocytophaga canimorsus]GIM56976.1 transcriptional regulator [Capnocytophaga canimorsus]
MDKTLILNKIIEYKKFKSDAEFARFLEIPAQNLSKWKSRNTYDVELLHTKCPELNPEWLLIGKEPMLKSEQNLPIASPSENQNEGIPLIPLDAMAGVGSGEVSVLELDCERYVIPMFKGADYLIPVKGSSMIPKYNSGDVVACKKLSLQDIFFQWNKVYVLDTEQGALIKRVCKGSDNEHITLVSDNEKYEPFELHKSQIYAIALVVGVVRLE